MSEVRVKDNESLDSALRRFKRQCAKSGVMSEIRKREHYEKPSVKRKKKSELILEEIYKMSLKEQLASDLKESMKNKQTVRKNTVQMVRTAILQKEKDEKVTLEDGDILEVIAKQLKQRKDTLPEYEKSGREDLISQLKEEMEVLMGYLPKQLTMDELRPIVEAAVKETGASTMRDMGKVMAAVMPQIKGRADGKAVNAIAKELFGN